MSPADSGQPGEHWAQINEFSFVAGMRLLFLALSRLFGRWPFRLVLYPVLLWYVLTKPAARAASSDYLKRLRSSKSAPGIDLAEHRRVAPFRIIRRKHSRQDAAVERIVRTDPVKFHGQRTDRGQIARQARRPADLLPSWQFGSVPGAVEAAGRASN